MVRTVVILRPYEFNYIFYSVLLCHNCNHIALNFKKKVLEGT